MFRANRGRLIGIVITIFVVYFLFTSSTDSEFRRRTEKGLAKKHGVLRGDLSDEALTQQTNDKLQGIIDKQKEPEEPAAIRAPLAPTAAGVNSKAAEVEDDVSVAGRKSMSKSSKDSSKPKYPVDKNDEDQKALSGGKPAKAAGGGSSEDPAKDIAREKLQQYLKTPIVIFSKSYCPHSKRAKHLLLDLYTIIPAPLVVELDQLTETLPRPPQSPPSDDDGDDDRPNPPAPTLGQKLQGLLGEITNRRTVPNIMVGMHSIGGNDNIWELHSEGKLADKIRELGGKRITSVEVKEVEKVEVGHDSGT